MKYHAGIPDMRVATDIECRVPIPIPIWRLHELDEGRLKYRSTYLNPLKQDHGLHLYLHIPSLRSTPYTDRNHRPLRRGV